MSDLRAGLQVFACSRNDLRHTHGRQTARLKNQIKRGLTRLVRSDLLRRRYTTTTAAASAVSYQLNAYSVSQNRVPPNHVLTL